jgi:hypothetical protein
MLMRCDNSKHYIEQNMQCPRSCYAYMSPFPTSLIQNIQFVAFRFLHNYIKITMSNIPHNECNGKKLHAI